MSAMKTIYRITNDRNRTLAKDGKFYGSYTPGKSGGTVECKTEEEAVRLAPAGCKPQRVCQY